MSLLKFNPRTVALLAFIIAVSTLWVLFNFTNDISPIANFSPLGAMAPFCLAHLSGCSRSINMSGQCE